jgi:hypothetical protein
MTPASVDLAQALREALQLARSAGLDEAADELEGRCFAAYTTSSEWLGEVGLAVVHFLSRERGQVPVTLERRLYDCLTEVQKVWPEIR